MRSNVKRYVLPAAILLATVGLLSFDAMAAEDTSVESGATSKSILDFVRSGGAVGYVIILLSFAGVALVIESFFRLKEEKLLPTAQFEQCEELAQKGKFSEIMTVCKAGDNMFSRILAYALARGQRGVDAVREAMQESGTRELTRLQQRVGYIGFIASVAPMLGLLGTVTGMIGSFNVLGMAKGAARPDELAVGISEALVTTCMGLIVAVPLMFFHNYFRDRVVRLGQEASGRCDRLVHAMQLAIGSRMAAKSAETTPNDQS